MIGRWSDDVAAKPEHEPRLQQERWRGMGSEGSRAPSLAGVEPPLAGVEQSLAGNCCAREDGGRSVAAAASSHLFSP